MNNDVLLLNSQLVEKIYGGTKIQEYFGLEEEMHRKIGEFWAVSAHPIAPSIVENGPYAGQLLEKVWQDHRELFANSKLDRFPLLVKIIAINSPVSIQVHPDDDYALANENDLGKAEFCIFLEVEEGTQLVRGHTARTESEFRNRIKNKQWNELFSKKSVKAGDYVYTPPGIIHGVEGKTLLAEVQQSSNVTYRLYDYENVDQYGNPREIHLEKAIRVTKIPHEEPQVNVHSKEIGNSLITNYCNNEFFCIDILDCQDEVQLSNESYSLLTVLAGNGDLKIKDQGYRLEPGVNAIVTSMSNNFIVSGELKLLLSKPPKE